MYIKIGRSVECDYASGMRGGEGKRYKGVLIVYISMTCRVRGCWEITWDEVVRGGWRMAALTFSVGSPHRTKYSDKTNKSSPRNPTWTPGLHKHRQAFPWHPLSVPGTDDRQAFPWHPSQCTRGQTTYTTDKPSHVTHLKVYHETDYTNT